ncbi:Flp pilus assembly protein CpaB [Sporichthya sp.]|uniref:Flp pilus assembly protein CpaB n=1 Tax=Sporichthya sp. TaxID=65475 RepID=UPI0018305774|nr:Flp pilus assembly protein CpaB [Sporichthya sp.]MBA3743388.1 Flp pilus assembly protein CpaB [Sporichthya sp.]
MSWGAEARMLLARYRGLVAGACAGVAVLAAVPLLAPGAGATVPVLTAARDLRWGAALAADDLSVVRVPVASVPDGALTSTSEARGRLLASPVRRGEPITDLRLVGPGLLADSELVAVGVRIADAGTAALLRAGSVVDVLAAALSEGFEPGLDRPVGFASAEVVASGVRVLAVPGAKRTGLDGALVLVAATEAQAARLAAAGATRRLSITLRPEVPGGIDRPLDGAAVSDSVDAP